MERRPGKPDARGSKEGSRRGGRGKGSTEYRVRVCSGSRRTWCTDSRIHGVPPWVDNGRLHGLLIQGLGRPSAAHIPAYAGTRAVTEERATAATPSCPVQGAPAVCSPAPVCMCACARARVWACVGMCVCPMWCWRGIYLGPRGHSSPRAVQSMPRCPLRSLGTEKPCPENRRRRRRQSQSQLPSPLTVCRHSVLALQPPNFARHHPPP